MLFGCENGRDGCIMLFWHGFYQIYEIGDIFAQPAAARACACRQYVLILAAFVNGGFVGGSHAQIMISHRRILLNDRLGQVMPQHAIKLGACTTSNARLQSIGGGIPIAIK